MRHVTLTGEAPELIERLIAGRSPGEVLFRRDDGRAWKRAEQLRPKWQQRCRKLAPRGNKNFAQYLTKEQQKACLDSAAAELIREITHQQLLS